MFRRILLTKSHTNLMRDMIISNIIAVNHLKTGVYCKNKNSIKMLSISKKEIFSL